MGHLLVPTAPKGPPAPSRTPCQPWHLRTRSCDRPRRSWSLMQKGKYSLHLTYLRVKMKQAHTGEKSRCYQRDIVESHDHNPILACDRDPAGGAACAGGQIGPCGWPLHASQGCFHLPHSPEHIPAPTQYLWLWEWRGGVWDPYSLKP